MARIFSVSVRAGLTRLAEPLARGLLRMGVSPNAVTVAGTLAVVAGSVVFAARGHFVVGAFVIAFFALTDTLDGTMARLRQADGASPTKFGAILDSTMDRVADGAVFGSLVYYMAVKGDEPSVVAALLCLLGAQLVPYVKARAEGLGLSCNLGVAERAERLIVAGVGAIATGLGLTWALPVALWLLAGLTAITVYQRLRHVSHP